jgi:hypothetical protein
MAISALGLLLGAVGLPALGSLYSSALKPGEISFLLVAPVLLVSLLSFGWVIFRLHAWTAGRGWIPSSVVSAWILIQAISTVISFRPSHGLMDGPVNAVLLVILIWVLVAGIRAKQPVAPSQHLSRWESTPLLWGLTLGIGAELIFGVMDSMGPSRVMERVAASMPWPQALVAGFAALSAGAMVCHWSHRRWPGLFFSLIYLAAMPIIWRIRVHGTLSILIAMRDASIIPLGFVLGTFLEWQS